jgi:hypothetical protein
MSISVRHDMNGNGKSDRSDGAAVGQSRHESQRLHLQAEAESGVRSFNGRLAPPSAWPVVLNYVNGLSFDPVE